MPSPVSAAGILRRGGAGRMTVDQLSKLIENPEQLEKIKTELDRHAQVARDAMAKLADEMEAVKAAQTRLDGEIKAFDEEKAREAKMRSAAHENLKAQAAELDDRIAAHEEEKRLFNEHAEKVAASIDEAEKNVIGYREDAQRRHAEADRRSAALDEQAHALKLANDNVIAYRDKLAARNKALTDAVDAMYRVLEEHGVGNRPPGPPNLVERSDWRESDYQDELDRREEARIAASEPESIAP